MSACLLIGNGLNRCFKGLSWDDLLKEIANEYFLSSPDLISASLKYEVLLNSAFGQQRVNKKSNFAHNSIKKLDNLAENYQSLYSKFTSLAIKDILTTNYDYAIERTLVDEFGQEDFKYVKYINEKLISKRRHTVLEDKNVYHIHGELSIPSSICLGTVHYAKNLSAIVESITEETEEGEVALKSSIFENSNLESWAEMFFKKDVYIIGLSLAECDIDLWWLITYRASLKAKGDSRIQNKIVFYDVCCKELNDGIQQRNKDRTNCLDKLYIEVKKHTISSDNVDEWKWAYCRIADDIAKDIDPKQGEFTEEGDCTNV